MFCGKCGTQNVEGTQFCAGCGAPLGGGSNNKKGGKKFNLPKINLDLKDRKTLIGLIAGAAALVLILAVLLFGGGAKGAVKKYMKACIKGNGKTIINMQPKKVINEIKDEGDMDKDDWKDYIEDYNEDLEDYFKALKKSHGGEPKITYEIVDQWSLDKKDEDFEDIQDMYDDAFDAKVSAVKAFEIDVTMKAGGEKEEKTITLYMVKIGLSWYPYVYSPDRFF